MTELAERRKRTPVAPRVSGRLPGVWTLGAALIAALVLLPIVAVLWMAATPAENIWPHLVRTTLPRYLTNTGLLMLGVGALSAAVGTGAAWAITMYRFPLSRILDWALLLPLAIPGYVGAYALVDFLEYAGPVQSALREVFGWTSARDYAFPKSARAVLRFWSWPPRSFLMCIFWRGLLSANSPARFTRWRGRLGQGPGAGSSGSGCRWRGPPSPSGLPSS